MSRGCPQLVLQVLEFLSDPLPQALWLHNYAVSGDIRTKSGGSAPRAPEPSVHGVYKRPTQTMWGLADRPGATWVLKKAHHRSESFHVRIVDSSSPTLTLIPPQVMLPKGMYGRVPLLATQKPVNRQVGGKENLLYFRCWQLQGRVVDICPDSPHPPDKQRVRAFIDRVEEVVGLHAETAQSSLTVIFNWSSVVWLASSWLF